MERNTYALRRGRAIYYMKKPYMNKYCLSIWIRKVMHDCL